MTDHTDSHPEPDRVPSFEHWVGMDVGAVRTLAVAAGLSVQELPTDAWIDGVHRQGRVTLSVADGKVVAAHDG